ncbi:MAG: sel1 repeat family protein [Magnetococcales bacterium]|nr:sel1 repeat family protein [Magnetococcales bacterium]NGZ28523.1 sel1 repeat family protein [Magnetococcales bacterium]
MALAGDVEKDFTEARQLFNDDNLADAVPILRRNVAENHLPSILLLAYIQDLAEENVEAVKLLRKAADMDSPQGQFYLGRMLSRGEDGVRVDLPEGRKWINKAVEAGYPPAMVYLSLAYRRGELGMSVDEDKAYKLLTQAAEKGYSPAMQMLSDAFRLGQMGLPKDKEEATYWNKEFQKAKKVEAEKLAKEAVPVPEPK